MEPIPLDDAPVLEFIPNGTQAATPVVLSQLPVVVSPVQPHHHDDIIYAATAAVTPESFSKQPQTETQQRSSSTPRKSHPRTLEVTVENVECIQSEAALRHCLLSLRGVLETRIDSISNTVFVDYDRHELSSPTILNVLRNAAFTPVRSALQGWRGVGQGAAPSLLSQITIQVPWVFRSANGWTLMQNHLLAQDGVGSCVFNAPGSEATVSFQARSIGARQLLNYASRVGAECQLVPATTSGHTQSSGGGDWRVMAAIAVALGGVPFIPAKLWMLGLPVRVWAQLAMCVCAAASHGLTHIRAAWTAAVARNFTAYLALVLSNLLLFTGSVLLLPAVWWMGRSHPLHFTAAACLQFDTVAWLLLVWAIGMRLSRRLKNFLYAPLKGLEKILQRRGRTRLLENKQVAGDGAESSWLDASLVQVGDSLLFKAGDRVWCDGYALTGGAVVKPPPLLSADGGPFEPSSGTAVVAGSLVMRGELRMRVTETDNSQLAQAALAARKGSLRPVARRRWLQRHASLTGSLAFLLGVAVAFKSLWSPSLAELLGLKWVSNEIYTAAPGARRFLSVLALVRAASCAAAAWLSLIGLAANSASAASTTATAGLCASVAGAVLHNCEALERTGRAKKLVLTRSVLTQRPLAQVTAVVVCPLACHAVLSSASANDLMTPDDDSPAHLSPTSQQTILTTRDNRQLSSVLRDRVVPGTEEGAASLVLRLLAHLEDAVVQDGTGGWMAGVLRDAAVSASGIDEVGASPGTVRAFVGKGIEGQPPASLSTASFGTAPAEGGGTAAAGSLDFIAGCHQYAFNTAVGVASKVAPREEWATLQRWAEAALHRGDRPVLVALNGRPLGAVLVEAPLSRLAKPVLSYLENQLGIQAHVCTSASPLSAGALSQLTGLPSERLMCGASQNDKMKFVEDLLQRKIGPVTVAGTDVSLLESVAMLPEAQGGAAAVVLTGELPSRSLRRKVDVTVPAQSLVNLLNLLYIANMARQVTAACKTLGVVCYCGALVWCALQPLQQWTLTPLCGLCLAFALDWVVLSVAGAITVVEPARLLRYSVTPLSENEGDLERQHEEQQNSVNLVYPTHTTFHRLIFSFLRRVVMRFCGSLGYLLISRRIGHTTAAPAWLTDPDLGDDTELKRTAVLQS